MSRHRTEAERLTAYICDACRRASREHDTHPGAMHLPGICDCACRDSIDDEQQKLQRPR